MSLRGWKTAQRASFLVGSESNVRQWGPRPAGPVRPSGPCCFGCLARSFSWCISLPSSVQGSAAEGVALYFHLFPSLSFCFHLFLDLTPLSLPHLSCCLNSFSFPGSTCFLSIVYLLLPLQSESAFCKQLPAASTELLLLMSGAARTKSARALGTSCGS